MKSSIKLTLTLAILAFVAETNSRPDRSEFSLLKHESHSDGVDLDTESDIHRHHPGNGRRTRHPRQTYSYQHIDSQLREINLQVKLIYEQLSLRQAPCPVVIPYFYPVQLNSENTSSSPSIGNRFNDEDVNDGTRPISLKHPKHGAPDRVRSPPVEHGSVQGGESPTTQKPVTTKAPKNTSRTPNRCEAAILRCCSSDESKRRECFIDAKCSKTYATGKACLPQVMDAVVNLFVKAYSPR